MPGQTSQVGVLDQLTGKRSNIRSPAEELKSPESPKADDPASSEKLHDAIVELVESHNAVARAVYGHPFATGVYVKNQELVSGTSVNVPHKLGTKVGYMVVNVRGAAANVYRPESNIEDLNNLKLTPGSSFTCDVFIYPEV